METTSVQEQIQPKQTQVMLLFKQNILSFVS